jgi:DNA-3-methyladenine glycosylase
LTGIPGKGTAEGDGQRLGPDFFEGSVHDIAPSLIGCRLFYDGVGGSIVEVEAYEREDPASHSFVGLTPRTKVMFGPPGRAYVYLSYGIHQLLNFVCEPEGEAAAVLIRALEPTAGLESMHDRRPAAKSDLDLCSGPGKLTMALGVFPSLAPRRRTSRRGHEPTHRNHESGGEAVAFFRVGQPLRIETPPGVAASGGPWTNLPAVVREGSP